MTNKKVFFQLVVLLIFLVSALEVFAAEIVIYSAREISLTKRPFRSFSVQTGIDIKLVTGKIDELLERLEKEGENSRADILLTVDAGSLWEATEAGMFQPVESPVLKKNIPASLRDPQNHWFGLSRRARTIIYSKEKVQPSELSTYADLADPKWKGRLCLRTAKKVYNQSLVAMMLSEHGPAETEHIIKGWVENLAVPPHAKDSKVINAIREGQCDVGVVNHYYLARMLKTDKKIPVGLFWPNQGKDEGGVYVDVSGAGILKNAKNEEQAIQLLEWLSSEKAQNLFADSNMEYPVNPGVTPHELVQVWGDFKQNTGNISHSGKNRDAAIELMEKAGYK